MDVKELAVKLAGATYRNVISRELAALAKEQGLVVLFGQSDDLMEFRGAIHDEVDCYDGGTAYVTRDGLLQNESEDADCPYFARLKAKATAIDALWCKEGDYSWTFRTVVPHETFEITSDGEPYCRGIVFALSDVPS